MLFMAEPTITTSTALTTLVIVALGPMTGQFAMIVYGALVGSLWALKNSDANGGRLSGAWLILRLVMTATVLSGAVSMILQRLYGWPAYETLAVVALCIAAIGDRWGQFGGILFRGVRSAAGRFFGSQTHEPRP